MVPCDTIWYHYGIIMGWIIFPPRGVLGSSSKDVAHLILKISVFALPEKRNQNSMCVMFELWFLVPWLSMGYSWITMVNHGSKKIKPCQAKCKFHFLLTCGLYGILRGIVFSSKTAIPSKIHFRDSERYRFGIVFCAAAALSFFGEF